MFRLALTFSLLCVADGLDAAGQLAPITPGPDANAFAVSRLESGGQIRVRGLTTNMLFHGPSIVRVNANLGRPAKDRFRRWSASGSWTSCWSDPIQPRPAQWSWTWASPFRCTSGYSCNA